MVNWIKIVQWFRERAIFTKADTKVDAEKEVSKSKEIEKLEKEVEKAENQVKKAEEDTKESEDISDSGDEDLEENKGLSEYEKKRLRNIAEQKAMFLNNLKNAARNLSSEMAPKPKIRTSTPKGSLISKVTLL